MHKLKKATFKYLENELKSFPDTLKEVKLLREEILHNSNTGDENIGGGKNNLPSDPTGTVATRLATHKQLLYLEGITNVIQKMYDSFPADYRKFIRVKYWEKENDKLPIVVIADMMGIGKNKAYQMREEVIQYLALELGYR